MLEACHNRRQGEALGLASVMRIVEMDRAVIAGSRQPAVIGAVPHRGRERAVVRPAPGYYTGRTAGGWGMVLGAFMYFHSP